VNIKNALSLIVLAILLHKTSTLYLHCPTRRFPLTYSTTPIIRINWDAEPFEYAENPDNWIIFENRLQWQFEVWMLLFTVRTCI